LIEISRDNQNELVDPLHFRIAPVAGEAALRTEIVQEDGDRESGFVFDTHHPFHADGITQDFESQPPRLVFSIELHGGQREELALDRHQLPGVEIDLNQNGDYSQWAGRQSMGRVVTLGLQEYMDVATSRGDID
jgi:hypothetical protein